MSDQAFEPASRATEPAGALEGIRVLSFGSFVAGGTAGIVLADLGAEVVKIEARARPEVVREPVYAFGDPVVEPSGVPQNLQYATMSRNLKGLSVDLETEQGRELFHRLVAAADVVIENFAGDTMARWGCSYEDLLEDNPKLVMLSLSGYGRTGPRAGYLAYGTNICAYVGLTRTWNFSHATCTDYITGATGALAVVAALQRARRTGVPTHLDVGQIDAMAGPLIPLLVGPLVTGNQDPPEPNERPGSWLAAVLACAGDDRWVAVELEDADDWSILCGVLERPDLDTDDPVTADATRGELTEALSAWVAERSPHTVTHVLQREGLAVGAVQDGEDIWHDPQLRTRDYFQLVDQPDLGPKWYPAPPYRLSRTPGRLRRSGPRLGEHTAGILREWLGVVSGELVALQESGAVFVAPDENDPRSR